MNPNWLAYSASFILAYLVLLGLHKRREGIAHSLRRLMLVGGTYMLVVLFLAESVKLNPVASVAVGVVAGLVVDTFIPKRSRYTPALEKRKVIERHESKTGEKYNPKRHDLGHIVPFKDGGSNTADNLKVERRKENRSKGAKSPWWDLLGGGIPSRQKRRR